MPLFRAPRWRLLPLHPPTPPSRQQTKPNRRSDWQAGLGRVKANLASRVKKGRMAQAAADATLARVRGALDYSGFGDVDMVIEAVIEVRTGLWTGLD